MAHLIARHSSAEPRRAVPEEDSYRKPKLLLEYEAEGVLEEHLLPKESLFYLMFLLCNCIKLQRA